MGTIIATDPDVGHNAEINMQIVNGNIGETITFYKVGGCLVLSVTMIPY